MTSRALTLYGDRERLSLIQWAKTAQPLSRAVLNAPKRSVPQNDRLFALLDIVAKLPWHGQLYSVYEWKDYFMHAYRGEKWMPGEDGGMVPIGRSTSALSREEHSELQTLIEAFCARHGVDIGGDENAR